MGTTKKLAAANWIEIAWITFTASVGIVALAGGLQNWFLVKTNLIERWVLIAAGLALTYPSTMGDIIGFICFAAVIATQWIRSSRARPGQSPGSS